MSVLSRYWVLNELHRQEALSCHYCEHHVHQIRNVIQVWGWAQAFLMDLSVEWWWCVFPMFWCACTCAWLKQRGKGVAAGLNHCYVCFCVWYIFLITLVPCKNEMYWNERWKCAFQIWIWYGSLAGFLLRARCRKHVALTQQIFIMLRKRLLKTEISGAENWQQTSLFASVSFLYIGRLSQRWLRPA